MEVLAVLMLVALVTSFAVPVYRSARHEMRNNQARAAAMKLAEAIRFYYQISKGYKIEQSHFDGLNSQSVWFSSSCDDVTASGVPPSSTPSASKPISNLFACGFLTPKDFAGVPYEFYVCNPNGSSSNCGGKSGLYVRIKGLAEAGKYENKYFNVDNKMIWHEE